MMNSIIDYSDYGVFNGRATVTNYNRTERRKYAKNHRNDKDARICPNCNYKTLFITDDNGRSFCELCGKLYPTIFFKEEKGRCKAIGGTK